jgi:hypothetical protein
MQEISDIHPTFTEPNDAMINRFHALDITSDASDGQARRRDVDEDGEDGAEDGTDLSGKGDGDVDGGKDEDSEEQQEFTSPAVDGEIDQRSHHGFWSGSFDCPLCQAS